MLAFFAIGAFYFAVKIPEFCFEFYNEYTHFKNQTYQDKHSQYTDDLINPHICCRHFYLLFSLLAVVSIGQTLSWVLITKDCSHPAAKSFLNKLQHADGSTDQLSVVSSVVAGAAATAASCCPLSSCALSAFSSSSIFAFSAFSASIWSLSACICSICSFL